MDSHCSAGPLTELLSRISLVFSALCKDAEDWLVHVERPLQIVRYFLLAAHSLIARHARLITNCTLVLGCMVQHELHAGLLKIRHRDHI